MSKQDILDYFIDINYAYNESTRLDTLSLMLDELMEQAASPWHRVEETPKEDGWYILGFLSRWKNGSWWIPKFPDYWMTAEPPKEDADGNK